MITVVKQSPNGDITGWMMATDMPELRRRAMATFDDEIAALAYRMEFTPTPGKYPLGPGVVMLVDG